MYREKSDSRQYSICTICRRTDHRRGSSEGFMQGVKSVTKQAFMKSIPIMCSYIFVSMAYGMMMENAGFAWYYSLLTSLTVYTGAFQFVLITFLSSGASIVTIAVTALFIIIFIDQWEKADKHFPAVAGVLIAVIALMIFGQRAFMLPALVIVSGVLIFWNSKQQEV